MLRQSSRVVARATVTVKAALRNCARGRAIPAPTRAGGVWVVHPSLGRDALSRSPNVAVVAGAAVGTCGALIACSVAADMFGGVAPELDPVCCQTTAIVGRIASLPAEFPRASRYAAATGGRGLGTRAFVGAPAFERLASRADGAHRTGLWVAARVVIRVFRARVGAVAVAAAAAEVAVCTARRAGQDASAIAAGADS